MRLDEPELELGASFKGRAHFRVVFGERSQFRGAKLVETVLDKGSAAAMMAHQRS